MEVSWVSMKPIELGQGACELLQVFEQIFHAFGAKET